MKKKAYVKATKPSLIVGMLVAFLMFVFGIVFLISLLGEPENGVGIAFLSIWLIIVLIIAGSYYINYKNYDKDSGSSFAGEIELPDSMSDEESSLTFDDKLRKLEDLKKDNLITEEEYNAKRKEIMNQKW